MSLQIEILEQSFEQVKPQADNFAFSFYQNLLTEYPQLRPLFARTNMEEQQQKLMMSLVLVVENLRNPNYLKVILKNLGERHVSYGAVQEHYPMVGAALLKTFEDYLGKDWTPEVKQAWTDAYGVLVDLMLEGAKSVEKVPSSKKVIQSNLEIAEASKAPAPSPFPPTTPKVEPTPKISQPTYQPVENSKTFSSTPSANVNNSATISNLENTSPIDAAATENDQTQPTSSTSSLNLKLILIVIAVLAGLCGIGFWYYQSQAEQDSNSRNTTSAEATA